MSILSGEVNEARLFELCAQECPESQTLEFKRTLPEKSDRDKAEFLKDVCALANSDGGDILYGVDEADGKARILAPITTEPADAAKRRLGQVIDAGIEPRIVGLQLREITVTGGYVMRLTVPASFNGPHRYSVGNSAGRFVMRNGTHTSDLSYGQLMAAFDRTATLTERARRFREQRLVAIRDRRTWRPIRKGPVCAVHLIPIASMAGNRSVDIGHIYYQLPEFSFWAGGTTRSTNLDGLIVHSGLAENIKEIPYYAQVFRSGALEAARFGGMMINPQETFIPSTTIAKFYRDALDGFLKVHRLLGLAGPAIIGAALLTTSGYAFGIGDHEAKTSDRADLVLPETWIDDTESITEVDQMAKPILDILWQAYNEHRCSLYTLDGRWNPKS